MAKKKKTTAKKVTAKKKTTAKKTATKKSTAKKTTAKKSTAKKTTATKKKTATKKVVAKTAVRKSTAKAAAGMPQVGAPAPAFTMKTDTSGTVKLSDFKGKSHVVLYFYPKDDTSGCTVEACAFQKSHKVYHKSGTTIIGVSPDSVESHGKFRKKYGLDFILASDPDHAVAETYGVWVEKNNYGKKYMGVQRATFLIGKDGRIAAAWPKVKVEGHDDQVQQAIANLD
jgi:peroxiredoxin Q/BCP